MKFLAFFAPVLAALSVSATTLPVRAPGLSVNPPTSVLVSRAESLNPPAPAPIQLTNAERLARGLPLKKPRRHDASRRATASAVPYAGTIEVFQGTTSIGYVGPLNAFGEFSVTTDVTKAQSVSFSAAPGVAFDIKVSGQTSLPYLSAINGYANTNGNLASGSYNYAYLGISTETAVGSKPSSVSNSFTSATNIQEAAESAIWHYDAGTSAITVQYVNADGSTPANYIIYSSADQALVITGDVAKFASVFGSNPTVTFKLVSA